MGGNEDSILTRDASGVRTISLNRPDVLNAFDEAMLKALAKAVRDAEKDKAVRCVLITGAGRAFSSGLDLASLREREASSSPIELGALLRDHFNPIIANLRGMEKPVLGSVNGVAAGAGCSLALACDVRVAAESSSFIQSFVNVGVIPDAGSTFMLPRLVGISRAMELAFTGRRVGSDEALRIGLVNHVASDDEHPSASMELAARLASLPTKAIGLAKRAMNASWSADLAGQLDYEAMLQSAAARSSDHKEGVAAFVEKRPPVFKGE